MYPYLRFIGADYEMDWETFQKHCCQPEQDDSYSRLAALLSSTMLRRTMKTSILNRPIITLPKPHPQIRYVDFSPQEALFYRIVSLEALFVFIRTFRVAQLVYITELTYFRRKIVSEK